MRGRKPVVAIEERHTIFQTNHDIIVRNNALLEPKNVVWENLKEKHFPNMSTKSIYESARKWLLSQNNTKRLHSVIDASTASSSSSDSSSYASESSAKRPKKANVLTCEITLPADKWKIIQPVTKEYKRAIEKSRSYNKRAYQVLPSGVWTTTILDYLQKIERIQKLNCNWSFKNSHVSYYFLR